MMGPEPELLSVKEARGYLYDYTRIHYSRGTLYNWMNTGIKSDTGDAIKLPYKIVANRRYTTAEWISEFLERVKHECS